MLQMMLFHVFIYNFYSFIYFKTTYIHSLLVLPLIQYDCLTITLSIKLHAVRYLYRSDIIIEITAICKYRYFLVVIESYKTGATDKVFFSMLSVKVRVKSKTYLNELKNLKRFLKIKNY